MSEGKESYGPYVIKQEDVEMVTLLLNAVQEGSRESVLERATKVACREYNIDGSLQLTPMPSWITDKELKNDERFNGAIIVVVPASNKVRKNPDSDLIGTFIPVGQDTWYKLELKQEGDSMIVSSLTTLVGQYEGVGPEDQDMPYDPSLN